jgi:Spy/CpxP family protein refolding chaperone
MGMLRAASLSDTQREQVKAVIDSERDQLAEEHQALAEARRNLQEAVQQGAEEPALRDKAAQIGTLEGDLAVTMADVHRQVQGILTDEQKQQIEKGRAERQKRLDQWREKQKERLQQMREGGDGPPFGGPMPFDEPPFDGPPPPDEPGR